MSASEDCVKITNPSLYCVETSDSFNHNVSAPTPVNDQPKSPEETSKSSSTSDPSATFDIVKATQYGVLERIHHLLDVEGVDVNGRDAENVTLLHWASINNRLEIGKLYLSRGNKSSCLTQCQLEIRNTLYYS